MSESLIPAPSDAPSPAKPKATRKTVRKTMRSRIKSSTGAKRNAAIVAAGGDHVGRPRRPYDPAVAKTVLDGLADGLPLVLACDRGEVSMDVVNRWAVENESFALGIKKAQQDFASETLKRLRTSPAGLWQREAWLLERRFPNQFGQNARIELQATQRVEVTAMLCNEISESWKQFRSGKTIEAQVENIGNDTPLPLKEADALRVSKPTTPSDGVTRDADVTPGGRGAPHPGSPR